MVESRKQLSGPSERWRAGLPSWRFFFQISRCVLTTAKTSAITLVSPPPWLLTALGKQCAMVFNICGPLMVQHLGFKVQQNHRVALIL